MPTMPDIVFHLSRSPSFSNPRSNGFPCSLSVGFCQLNPAQVSGFFRILPVQLSRRHPFYPGRGHAKASCSFTGSSSIFPSTCFLRVCIQTDNQAPCLTGLLGKPLPGHTFLMNYANYLC